MKSLINIVILLILFQACAVPQSFRGKPFQKTIDYEPYNLPSIPNLKIIYGCGRAKSESDLAAIESFSKRCVAFTHHGTFPDKYYGKIVDAHEDFGWKELKTFDVKGSYEFLVIIRVAKIFESAHPINTLLTYLTQSNYSTSQHPCLEVCISFIEA